MAKIFSLVLAVLVLCCGAGLQAADVNAMKAEANEALRRLHVESAGAAMSTRGAHAILVFPAVGGGGLLAGFEAGSGVMFVGGQAVGFYHLHALSSGFLIGWRKYGYVLHFADAAALERFYKTAGFEIGLASNLTADTDGFAGHGSTTTWGPGVTAWVFDADGLMVNLGLQITKISRFTP